jgi:hypothetical protein
LLFLLFVELNAVPVNLIFYLAVASGVSLLIFPLICLLLLHYVRIADDLVVDDVVNAVVAVTAVLKKLLLLGHLVPAIKVPVLADNGPLPPLDIV